MHPRRAKHSIQWRVYRVPDMGGPWWLSQSKRVPLDTLDTLDKPDLDPQVSRKFNNLNPDLTGLWKLKKVEGSGSVISESLALSRIVLDRPGGAFSVWATFAGQRRNDQRNYLQCPICLIVPKPGYGRKRMMSEQNEPSVTFQGTSFVGLPTSWSNAPRPIHHVLPQVQPFWFQYEHC